MRALKFWGGSFLVSGGGQQSFTFLGLQLHHSDLCLCYHMAILTSSSVCACLAPDFPFSEGHQSYWIRVHRNELILT